MALYKASVQMDYYVEASDEAEALMLAKQSLEDAVHDPNDAEFSVSKVVHLQTVPKVWRNSLPYGDGSQDLTCEQILSSGKNTSQQKEDSK